MSGTGRKKREEPQGNAWLGLMLDLLRFSVVALAAALGAVGVAAALISFGVFGEVMGERMVIAACLLGSFLGAALAVRRGRGAPLPTGLGVGAIAFLLLLTAGMMLCGTWPDVNRGWGIGCACLCGGGLAGVLIGKPKKKRRV